MQWLGMRSAAADLASIEELYSNWLILLRNCLVHFIFLSQFKTTLGTNLMHRFVKLVLNLRSNAVQLLIVYV
jgi:hypothetical protein